MERLQKHVNRSCAHLKAPASRGKVSSSRASRSPDSELLYTTRSLPTCCLLQAGAPRAGPPPKAELLSASLWRCLASRLIMLPASAAEGAKKGGSIYHKDEDEEGGPSHTASGS